MTTVPPASRPTVGLARATLIQAGGFGLGLAVHMLLSRWLGTADYGDLSATLSVAMLGATYAVFCFDRASAPTLSSLVAAGRGDLVAAFTRTALLTTLASTLVVAGTIYGGAVLAETILAVDEHPVRYAAFLVPFVAFALLLGSVLTGLRHPLVSEILGQVTGRVVLLALAAAVYFGAVAPSEARAVGLVAVAWVVPLGLLALVSWRTWPEGWTATSRHPDREKAWRGKARAYLVATLPLVALEESGILLMELLHTGEEAVGVYAAAHRTAGLPLIALAAARQIGVPELAAMRHAGREAFEAQLRPYLRFTAAVGVLAMVVFVVFGDAVLALFGDATEEGHVILVLLGGAYTVFLVAGFAAPVLQLHEEHRVVIGCMVALLALSVLLGPLLIPLWSGEGLAAGYLAVNVGALGYLMAQVRRRTAVRYLSLLWKGRPV